MTKVIDNTNLGYLISKIKAAFWPKTDTIQIGLDNTPTANSDNLVKSGGVKSALDAKQDTLVSGTNIKTINNQSLLGSGNLTISGGSGSGSGDENVIEAITFNGVAATIDSSTKTAAITATIPSAPGTLNTTATTAQSTSSSEALSGSVTLHKIAKTGAFSDLIGAPTMSDYVPKSGGTMNDNASLEFEDDEGFYSTNIGHQNIKLYDYDDISGVEIDSSSPGMKVMEGGLDGSQNFSLYSSGRIINAVYSESAQTRYTIDLPTTTGTLALTSQIPSTLDNISDGTTRKLENFYFVQGTSSQAGNSTSGSYLSTKWEGTIPGVSAATDGLKLAYRIATNAGVSTAGVVLSIDGTNYYPVVIQKNTMVTTHYPVGATVLMVFNSTQTGTAYLTSNTKSTVTGCWQIMEYDSNTNTYQRLYVSTGNTEYPITTRYNTTSGETYYAEYGRYAAGVTLNPSTNSITASKFIVTNGTSSQFLKADGSVDSNTYLTSFTETDPVFSASAASGITSSDITNWNGKTSNTGTVTGVKMNGTTNNPTSGVVDLGTVITSETSLSKGTTSGNGNAVTDISVSGHQITLTKGSTFLTSETSLSKGTTSGNGNAVTDISVSGHQITLTKGSTFLTSETQLSKGSDSGSGNVVTDVSVSNHQITLTKGSTVPVATSANAGKIPRITSAGAWEYVTPSAIYSGSGTPSNGTGNNGDVYLQTS